MLRGIQNEKLLDKLIWGWSPIIRLELERTYCKKTDSKKNLALLSKGGDNGEASSPDGENEEEMSDKEDTTEELAKVVLAALAWQERIILLKR